MATIDKTHFPFYKPDHFIYLATPITHSNSKISQARFATAMLASRRLIKLHHPIICPATFVAPLVGARAADYWYEYTARLLYLCNELWVLPQPGWDTSKGVRSEIRIARKMKLPVRVLKLAKAPSGLPPIIEWEDFDGYPPN